MAELGSNEWPIVPDPSKSSEGIVFNNRLGVLFFVEFAKDGGLEIHARRSAGKRLVPLKAQSVGCGVSIEALP